MKKVLSLLLVLILSLGMTSMVSAFSLDPSDWTGPSQSSINNWVGSSQWSGSGNHRNFSPQGERKIETYIPAEMFYNLKEASHGVTLSGSGWGDWNGETVISWQEARALKLNLKIRVAKGASTIDTYKIKNDKRLAKIEVEFVEKLRTNDTDNYDVDFDLVLFADKTEAYRFTVADKYSNEEVEVWADDDYVLAEKGRIVTGEEYNKEVEVDLGEGVSLFTKVFKGKDYWAWVDFEEDEADDRVMVAYPDVERVINLDVIGYASTIQHVDVSNVDGTDHFVYGVDADGELTYLGKSGSELPYTKKYYLSNKELDVDGGDLEEPDDGDDEGDGEELPPTTGGDDTYPENINDNPGTGK